MALHSGGVLAVWGCAVQWNYGSTSACCVGVVTPGESPVGVGRLAATTPVGVAILLGVVVGDFTANSPGSSHSGESQDPVVGSGGGVAVASSSTSFPSLGHCLEDFDFFGASYD